MSFITNILNNISEETVALTSPIDVQPTLERQVHTVQCVPLCKDESSSGKSYAECIAEAFADTVYESHPPNRQFYVYKFMSSRLKEYNYNLSKLDFNTAKELREVISLADSQMLRTIRDIRKRTVNYQHLERWFLIRDFLKKKIYKLNTTVCKLNSHTLKRRKMESYIQELVEMFQTVQDKINRTMFIPDYVTVVIEHPSHYEYIFKHGLYINGHLYKRLSCSAGQARASTVVLCNTEILDEVKQRLNNNRDLTKKIAPSKFNAYFGLSGSSTFIVSEPRAIVVKDYVNFDTFKTHFVQETGMDEDDIVMDRETTSKLRRTDGMGLISPRLAIKWAKELGLDYIPSQFGIRQAFIKGMLAVFDFHQFCEEKNNGNYLVDTIYTDKETGEPIKADLREYDLILSESQFKLWDSYNSFEEYTEYCHKNKLYWGIPQYSPKEAKDILRMNYQFLQTLNLDSKEKIEDICAQFVDWIEGVSYDKFPYMILFLLGVNNTEHSIKQYLNSREGYWIKSLIMCPELREDKYICNKIQELIKVKIRNGCMGEIIVNGNFQTLVSDPYGFMQHVCGQEVTGLLQKGEFYSNYWNERGVTQVDGMRSPLTFRSEHIVMNLRCDEETEKWYKYCKLGIILNYHGHEVENFGGADFDLDILATTSNRTVIDNVYTDELTMTYDVPSPEAKLFTEEDLYQADLFGFGSIIGSITNKSSIDYALLPNLKKKYGEDSQEYKIAYSRLIQCCKAQSCQIDKTKIGRSVKGIPSIWVNYSAYNIDKDTGEILDSLETQRYKDFNNSILLDKYPYFFKYRYKKCKQLYDKYIDENNITACQKFRKPLNILLDTNTSHTLAEKEFIENFYEYMPVVFSDSPMNMLCRYIEGINFNLKKKIKGSGISTETIEQLKHKNLPYTDKYKKHIIQTLENYLSDLKHKQIYDKVPKEKQEEKIVTVSLEDYFFNHGIHNMYMALNCLIDYYYLDNPNKSKDVLWTNMGNYIFNNIKRNCGNTCLFPLPCSCFSEEQLQDRREEVFTYLEKEYIMERIDLHRKSV